MKNKIKRDFIDLFQYDAYQLELKIFLRHMISWCLIMSGFISGCSQIPRV